MLYSIKLRQNINMHGLLETAWYINTSYADPWWTESTLLQDTIGSHTKNHNKTYRKIDAANCTHKRLQTCKIQINWQVVPDTYNTSAKKNSVVNLLLNLSPIISADKIGQFYRSSVIGFRVIAWTALYRQQLESVGSPLSSREDGIILGSFVLTQ